MSIVVQHLQVIEITIEAPTSTQQRHAHLLRRYQQGTLTSRGFYMRTKALIHTANPNRIRVTA